MTLPAKNPVFIAIEGPIGVGKSVLIDALEKEYGKNGIHAFKEELDPNPFLDKFYDDKKKYAFQTQIAFLLSRYKQCENLQKIIKQPEMFSEPKIYVSDFVFDKNDIFAELTIDDEQEWKLYQKIRDSLENTRNFLKPNFIVYLRAGEETLYRRIQSRHHQTIKLNLQSGAGDGYKGITKEYLKQLTALYDRHFFHYKHSPVLIIDVNNADFAHTEQNISIILGAIKKSIETSPPNNIYIKLDDN